MTFSPRTRALVTASALTLTALGLTACGSTPTGTVNEGTPSASTPAVTPSPTPSVSASPLAADPDDVEGGQEDAQVYADILTLMEYRDVVSDAQTLINQISDAYASGGPAETEQYGNDLVLLAFKGRKLDNIPDASRVINKTWDEAMDNLQVAGGMMQTSPAMFSMVVDELETFADNIVTVSDSFDD